MAGKNKKKNNRKNNRKSKNNRGNPTLKDTSGNSEIVNQDEENAEISEQSVDIADTGDTENQNQVHNNGTIASTGAGEGSEAGSEPEVEAESETAEKTETQTGDADNVNNAENADNININNADNIIDSANSTGDTDGIYDVFEMEYNDGEAEGAELEEKFAIELTVDRKRQNLLKRVLTLCVITVATALILTFANGAAAPIIRENIENEKVAAIKSLFSGYTGDVSNISAEKFSGMLESPVTEILYIKNSDNDALIGYCIGVQPKGFNGKINMFVALDKSKKIIGMNIIDMSETARVGMRVDDESFLSQFNGKAGNIDLNDIDIIGGATTSSKAIIEGINGALESIE